MALRLGTFIVLTACVSAQAIAASTIVRPGLWEIAVTTRVSEVRTGTAHPVVKAPGQSAEPPAELLLPVAAPDVTRTSRECLTAPAARDWTALTKMARDLWSMPDQAIIAQRAGIPGDPDLCRW